MGRLRVIHLAKRNIVHLFYRALPSSTTFRVYPNNPILSRENGAYVDQYVVWAYKQRVDVRRTRRNEAGTLCSYHLIDKSFTRTSGSIHG